VSYVFDYFLKDHLGNVRMVLTTKSDTSQYAATMETAATATENVLFTNIDNTRSAKPTGYPTDGTTNPNDYVARLNATNGQKIGPSIVLRVIAGDSIQLGAKAFYKSTAANTASTPVSSMLAALLQSFSGAGISDGAHYATGSNSPLVTSFTSTSYDQLKQKDPSQNLTDKPKAYLNYVLFDDQFKLVDENSGVRQVQGSPDALQTLSTGKTVVKKTGFLYIYTSNESGTDVFFDNLVVVHNSGPLLEETHYYPFGLGMAGISSAALKGMSYPENRKKYNGNELQNKEFADGSGLELYDFNARTYDAQIGRFVQIDPDGENSGQESQSLYHFSLNNPILYNDPDGKDPIKGVVKVGRIVWNIARAVDKMSEVKKITLDDIVAVFSPVTMDKQGMAKSAKDLDNFLKKSEKADKIDKEVKSLEKGNQSLEKQISEHEIKLDEYKKDPSKYDNKDRLKDATPENKQKIYEGRIQKLEKEIGKFKDNINKNNSKIDQLRQDKKGLK
jgi:RHS repeat-associated protein